MLNIELGVCVFMMSIVYTYGERERGGVEKKR